MANPVLIDITQDEWNLVASAVTTGQISIISNTAAQILTTYRAAGDPAPITQGPVEGVAMSRKSIKIMSSNPIDVYLYPQEANGKVRVDL